LPDWLVGVLEPLKLPPHIAEEVGSEATLLAVIRLAVRLAQSSGCSPLPQLLGDLEEDESLAGVRLVELPELPPCPVPPDNWWVNPYSESLLVDLMRLAIERRQQAEAASHDLLQKQLDDLHTALERQLASCAEQLRLSKLRALAEFAAGAGHEINNPLAVISGQAQYLLAHEADWFLDDEGHVRKALETIIGQTKRIHGLLRDLMQFARPAPARANWFDLPTLLGEIVASSQEFAACRSVRVEMSSPVERLAVLADREQVRTALVCLVRNAVEAAGAEGWVRLVLDSESDSHVAVLVEDSGRGPTKEQRPHLFDPFYSGRNAGRGRGLGLPVAWRLAREQGGDVWLEPERAGQPTRFVLSLPRHSLPPDQCQAA
jgi:two-component system NtrC family sensor kinase